MPTIIETTSLFTTLGIRFWDPATDAPVPEGLQVTARVPALDAPRFQAFTTASGVYAFEELPGMFALERSGGDAVLAAANDPARRRSFIIAVDDPSRRFLPLTFRVALPLPYRGLFPSPIASSPPDESAARFYLFSAPTRAVVPPLAVVRGQLGAHTGGAPVANALIEVQVESRKTWYGLSDDAGRFAVLFPYPALTIPLGASPPAGGRVPLHQQRWRVTVRVRSAPELLQRPPRPAWPPVDPPPYLHTIAAQRDRAPLAVWTAPTAAVPEFDGEVSLGRELVLRTEQVTRDQERSKLLVGA